MHGSLLPQRAHYAANAVVVPAGKKKATPLFLPSVGPAQFPGWKKYATVCVATILETATIQAELEAEQLESGDIGADLYDVVKTIYHEAHEMTAFFALNVAVPSMPEHYAALVRSAPPLCGSKNQGGLNTSDVREDGAAAVRHRRHRQRGGAARSAGARPGRRTNPGARGAGAELRRLRRHGQVPLA